jgi:hypothetical protein
VIVLPVLLVLILANILYQNHPMTLPGRVSMWLLIGLTLVVSVGLIGVFEGGYNHLAKDVLYFAGVPRSTFDRLFPAPAYERPDDLWFEVTGVLQFFLGLCAAYYLLRLWRENRVEGGAASHPPV